MAAQLAAQQDDETSEIVLRAACADGGLDRLLLQLRMRCHPSRTALITYAESYLRRRRGRTCCGGCARAGGAARWRGRRRGKCAVLLERRAGRGAAPTVLIGERNPMRAKGKVARTRRRRASELAGTDYDGARAFLQGLGYATKAPGTNGSWTTLRPQERRAHYALAGRGDARLPRQSALTGDDGPPANAGEPPVAALD